MRFRSRDPIRSPADFGDPDMRLEVAHCLANANVAWVDYNALYTDFPHLRPEALALRFPNRRLTGFSKEEAQKIAKEWLLRHTAVISDNQIRHPNIVNTCITTTGRSLIAHRPPRYGRAMIINIRDSNRSLPYEQYVRWHDEPDGLLDVKGCGTAPGVKPNLEAHGNGLMMLWQAIEEVLRQRLIEAVFRHAGVDVTGVPVYAVLHFDFECKTHSGEIAPAGALIRRAHMRPISGIELPRCGSENQQVKLEIEFLLRQYGITSANPGTKLHIFESPNGIESHYAGLPMPHVSRQQLRALVNKVGRPLPWHFDCINVQQTINSQLPPVSG